MAGTDSPKIIQSKSIGATRRLEKSTKGHRTCSWQRLPSWFSVENSRSRALPNQSRDCLTPFLVFNRYSWDLGWAAMTILKMPAVLSLVLMAVVAAAQSAPQASSANVFAQQEGFVDANGVMIYYKILGRGEPLMIVHGGPGASHDYFLPYLLPLARRHKLIFIDERGSGRSQKLEDPAGYTIANMAEDVESVRQALGLGKINLLGHSYGGALAQAYALKYQSNLSHLILGSTWSSTKAMNEVFVRMKQHMTNELSDRIAKLEAAGLFGHGKDYEKNRYTAEYMIAAWGEGYFPYLYHNRPDPNYDPVDAGKMSWDLYREMWGSNGEFVIDGNLKSVEYTDRLSSIKVPTLILVGDHDECDPSLAKVMQEKISGSNARMNLDRTFFITTVTRQRTPLFRSQPKAELMMDVLLHYREQMRYVLHEFVIMPDHLHLLLTPEADISLKRALQLIKGGFSYLLRKAKRGLVWQESFTNHRIRDEHDYERHAGYIRMNPVRARLVERPEMYPYSSASARFGRRTFGRGTTNVESRAI